MEKRPTDNGLMSLTVDLPKKLVQDAQALSGGSVAHTLIKGLQLIKEHSEYYKAMALKGKIPLEIDLDEARGRR